MRIQSSSVEGASRVYEARMRSPGEHHHHGHENRAASVSVSKPGQLLDRLRELQDVDPGKFEELLNDFAADLDTAASQSGSGRLARLADRFAEAAESGELPSFGRRIRSRSTEGADGGPRPSGHHGHHGGARQVLRSFIEDALAQVEQALAFAEANAASGEGGTEAAGDAADGAATAPGLDMPTADSTVVTEPGAGAPDVMMDADMDHPVMDATDDGSAAVATSESMPQGEIEPKLG